ncbi:hypothetical protein MPTA9338_0020 [Mycoplasmoides pneumoniae]
MAISKKKRFFFDLAQDEDDAETVQEVKKVEQQLKLEPVVQPQHDLTNQTKANQFSQDRKFFSKDMPQFDFGPLLKFGDEFVKSFNQFPKQEPQTSTQPVNVQPQSEPTNFNNQVPTQPVHQTAEVHLNEFQQPTTTNFNQQPVATSNIQVEATQPIVEPVPQPEPQPAVEQPQVKQTTRPSNKLQEEENLPPPKAKVPGIIPLERQERLTTGVHFYTSTRVWNKVKRYAKAVNIPISRILTMILDQVIEE